MNQTTANRPHLPVTEELDPEVVAFRQNFEGRSPLDELVHEGARRMLQAAIDAEVATFIEQYFDGNGDC